MKNNWECDIYARLLLWEATLADKIPWREQWRKTLSSPRPTKCYLRAILNGKNHPKELPNHSSNRKFWYIKLYSNIHTLRIFSRLTDFNVEVLGFWTQNRKRFSIISYRSLEQKRNLKEIFSLDSGSL